LDEGQTMFELVKIFIENFILFVTKNSLNSHVQRWWPQSDVKRRFNS